MKQQEMGRRSMGVEAGVGAGTQAEEAAVGATGAAAKQNHDTPDEDAGAGVEVVSDAPAICAPLRSTPSLDDLLVLEAVEQATGHVQHGAGSGVDDEALADSVSAIPDHISYSEDAPTPCAFITGIAGSGKTYTVRERCSVDPTYAALSSSTGISAVNLNTITIHSLLGFFDTDSLRDAYLKGSAQTKLKKLAEEGYRNVVIDEFSMIGRDILDLLVRVFDDVNTHRLMDGAMPIGLIAVGDYAQLAAIADRPAVGVGWNGKGRRPSLPIPWAFESQFWGRFEQNETRLTKVWRQADARFLAALNFARVGNGRECVGVLRSVGQRFESMVDHEFQGTTIVGKNDEVDRINQIRLDKVRGRLIEVKSRRWAAGGGSGGAGGSGARTEWKHIPERLVLREGCYVMILANKYEDRSLVYANGDCGWVRGIQSRGADTMPSIMVELVRTGEIVQVEGLIRSVDWGDKPGWVGGEWQDQGREEDGGWLARPHYRKAKRRYVTAQIQYYPLRLAYASTVHRAQGLSLDRVQVDFRGWMFARTHSMTYVSLSRARTLEGLRLVGPPEMLAERCKVDPKVARWL